MKPAYPSQAGGRFRSRLDRWQHWDRARTSGGAKLDTHHEMEINFVERGKVTYLFGGRILDLPVGRLLLFWGATPHRVIDCRKDARHHWLVIPLAAFLQWGLADTLLAQLMVGELLAESDAKWQTHDRAAFHRWHQDLESTSPEHHHVVALEVEARLRRLSMSSSTLCKPAAPLKPAAPTSVTAHQRVERMATYLLNPVPEPATLALMVLGLGGLTLLRKRRHQ